MLKRSIASLWHDTGGAAFLEAALVMPVLAALLFGGMEFSWYFHQQQMVESGVRDAARYLARTAPDTTPPTSPCDNATFVGNAKNIAVTGKISGGTARVRGWTVGSVTITCPAFDNSGAAYQGASTIYRVKVITNFTYPALGFFGNFINLTTPLLSASHTERSIGPG
jgi:Flp pilus assembly protein TadG